jgi:hypothetical protein
VFFCEVVISAQAGHDGIDLGILETINKFLSDFGRVMVSDRDKYFEN